MRQGFNLRHTRASWPLGDGLSGLALRAWSLFALSGRAVGSEPGELRVDCCCERDERSVCQVAEIFELAVLKNPGRFIRSRPVTGGEICISAVSLLVKKEIESQ